MRLLSFGSPLCLGVLVAVFASAGCGTDSGGSSQSTHDTEGRDSGGTQEPEPQSEPGATPEPEEEPDDRTEPEAVQPDGEEPEPSARPEPAPEPESSGEPDAAEPAAEPESDAASPEPSPEAEPETPPEPAPEAEPESAPDGGDDDVEPSDSGPTPPECACLTAPAEGQACDCAGCEESVEVTSALHSSEPIDYDEKPPAGGNHASCWGTWGVHDTPLPDDNFVHNQEHGGVILLYNCPDGCDAERAELEAFVADHELTILTEYPDMDARFAVTSWGYRLLMECLDMDAVGTFYDNHVDRAPEQFGRPPPNPGSGCP